MKFWFLQLITLTLIVETIKGAQSGITASLGMTAIGRARDIYFNAVMSVLKDVEIPDLDFTGGHVHSNSFMVVDSTSNFQVTDDPEVNGLVISIDSLTA